MAIFNRIIGTKSAATDLLAASETSGAGAAAAAPQVRAAAPSTVFVELGEAAQKAQIARDGVGVPHVALNTDVLQNLIAGRPLVINKVVSQSVAPGTPVPKGTPIDVVFAPPFALPIDVIRDPHVGLAGRTLGSVYDTFIVNNPDVRNVLARNDSAATLSTADQAVIKTAFQGADVAINDEAGSTMQQAFSSLQAALAFGG